MSHSSQVQRPRTTSPPRRGRITWGSTAIAPFATWTVATYLFEGLPRTLLRPEAAALRLAYAALVNIAIGVVASMWTLRQLIQAGVLNQRVAGFGDANHTLTGLVTGRLLDAGLFVPQGAPSHDPVVLLNGSSQVVVSAAEGVVCWGVVGTTLEAIIHERSVPLRREGTRASYLTQ